ncbi:MAG TPA: tetratricopeptide repeat protein [Verrucomicrobiae bacterium]|nr:tetratricopeptide repeat protein [Verrucomicrobiae bacterium]
MRWIASLALILVLTGVTRAAGPDDQYLDIYNEIGAADSLLQGGQPQAAADKYVDAQARLKKIKDIYPDWNPDVISFRLNYISDKLVALGNAAQHSAAAPVVHAPSPSVPAASVARPDPALLQQIATLQEQVRSLLEERAEMGNKLKEALSIQPAAVSPVEMAKRDAEIVALQKEKDLLTVDLQQAKAAQTTVDQPSSGKAASDLAAAKHAADEANRKLEEANRKMSALKAESAHQINAATYSQVVQERDQLKEELAARSKDLADSEAHGSQELVNVREQFKEAAAQRDELQKKLDAANAASAATSANSGEIDQLRARVAVLESKPVPLTPEEIAIVNAPTAQQLPILPAPTTTTAPASASPVAAAAAPEKPRVVHSAKDLPPGAGAMMADGIRASLERDYPRAEEKFKEILHQDENNVYVLVHLADTQFAEGNLSECEKNVTRALELDKDDSASLYLMGILRYRQEKLDEGLDALSRSAQLNTTNPSTQFYLGCVLADKGMRPAAETAFRKALQLEPNYSDAHFNLALVYATEKPPSTALARWHYKRALSLGHERNPKLEAILGADKQP